LRAAPPHPNLGRMASSRLELLRRVPLFSDLERRELDEIASSLKERTFDAGQTIATEGESAVGFFVIEDGEARVTVGGEERGRLRAGDYFGEIALIAESDRTATVVAETELRCLGMTFWDFRPLVEQNGKVAWKLLQALAQKLRQAEQRAG
jgi:CRP/FNR family cyclic AMP-dependent transcriptional regulator